MNHDARDTRLLITGVLAVLMLLGGCPTTQPNDDTSGNTFVPPTNTAPSADAGADQFVTAGDDIVLNATGSSDPDNDPITYFWQQTGGDVTLDIPSPGAAITRVETPADLTEMTVVTMEVTVVDGQAFDSDTTQITITPDE